MQINSQLIKSNAFTNNIISLFITKHIISKEIQQQYNSYQEVVYNEKMR